MRESWLALETRSIHGLTKNSNGTRVAARIQCRSEVVMKPAFALSAALFFLTAAHASAGAPATRRAPRIFDVHEPLTLDLEADWQAIRRDRSPAPTPRPAKLSYDGPSGRIELPIQIETRGRSRLSRDVCEFPPLRLDFAKESRESTLFRGIAELKLVTHCNSERDFEQNVVLEYLLYRSYALLTEHHFRVRLLHVRYVDPGEKKPRFERAGFVIEDAANLAKRIGAERVKATRIDRTALDPISARRVEMFYYMVGMTDFSLVANADGGCCHNARAFRLPSGLIAVVPYDFDQTGVVNPPYAIPAPGLGIQRVTQRVFRGRCRAPEEHRAAIDELVARRAEITALFEAEARLNAQRRKRALDFLGRFYAWAADPAKSDATLAEECRKDSV
jgi:hypothetical protein